MSHNGHEHDDAVPDRNANDPPPDPSNDTAAKPQLPAYKLSPELIAWARENTSDEEIMAAIREIEETGGLTFEQLMEGMEDILSSDD